MKIEKFVIGIVSTNCYLAINEETKQTMIIDPGACPAYLLNHIKSEGLKVEGIFLTHGHYDHMLGLKGFCEAFDVPVYVHQVENDMLKTKELNLSTTYTDGYEFFDAVCLQDGQNIEFAGYSCKVIHTPGHTPGGTCYYVESEGVLFSGDTLFQNSVGRTDFPGGSVSELVRGIKEKLFVLPEQVLVYPGHMGETTIGHEKKHNPFLS